MKKRNFGSTVFALGATVLGAALVQGCGSGSAPAALPPGGSSVISSITDPVDGGLYEVCSYPTEELTLEEYYGIQIQSAFPTNATDGSNDPLCQIQMTESYETPYTINGDLPVLSSMESFDPITTGISLDPYDTVSSIQAYGNLSTGNFINNCSSLPSGSALTGQVYAEIPGSTGAISLPSTQQITIPDVGEELPLLIGVNESPGATGCFNAEVTATITRCVDSSGLTHPCP